MTTVPFYVTQPDPPNFRGDQLVMLAIKYSIDTILHVVNAKKRIDAGLTVT